MNEEITCLIRSEQTQLDKELFFGQVFILLRVKNLKVVIIHRNYFHVFVHITFKTNFMSHIILFFLK
jgi:hypothetical protein